MSWKIITFILGLIPASIIWFVGSQLLALFLLWIIKILWFSGEVRSGLLDFSFMIIGILIVFLWWRWVFKKEQKKSFIEFYKDDKYKS